jgi:hypothetical protein
MLESAKEIIHYRAKTQDGKAGRAQDLYFEDRSWAIRFLLLNVGQRLLGPCVLVPPDRLGPPNNRTRCLPLAMTWQEALACASSENAQPVSHQMQHLVAALFGGTYAQGGGPVSPVHPVLTSQAAAIAEAAAGRALEGPSLRSVHALLGYRIEALDGPLGVVEDFLIDDDEWVIRYVLVNTKTWKPGRQVLLPPSWVQAIVWSESRIHVAVRREKIRTSARFHAPSHAHSPKAKPTLWS